MNSLNSIFLEGNLTRDPDFSHTPKGKPLCEFSIAVNRYNKINNEYQEEVSFFDITTWAKVAEACNQYLKKGRGVRIVGRLKQDRWIEPSGMKRSKVYIIADNVEFKPVYKETKETKETVLENKENYYQGTININNPDDNNEIPF